VSNIPHFVFYSRILQVQRAKLLIKLKYSYATYLLHYKLLTKKLNTWTLQQHKWVISLKYINIMCLNQWVCACYHQILAFTMLDRFMSCT